MQRERRRDDQIVTDPNPKRTDMSHFPITRVALYHSARGRTDGPNVNATVEGLANASDDDIRNAIAALQTELQKRSGKGAGVGMAPKGAPPSGPSFEGAASMGDLDPSNGRGDSKTEAEAIAAKAERTANQWRGR